MLAGVLSHAHVRAQTQSTESQQTLAQASTTSEANKSKHFVIVKPDNTIKIFEKTSKGLRIVKGNSITKADRKAIREAKRAVRKEKPLIKKINKAY